jgi:hypothetical protein
MEQTSETLTKTGVYTPSAPLYGMNVKLNDKLFGETL